VSNRRLNSPTNHRFHRARRRARQISPTKSKAGSGQTHAKGVARACRPRARDASVRPRALFRFGEANRVVDCIRCFMTSQAVFVPCVSSFFVLTRVCTTVVYSVGRHIGGGEDLDSQFGFRPTHAAAEPPRVDKPAKLNAAAIVLLMNFRTAPCIVPALAAVALRFFDGCRGALFDAGALRFFSAFHFLQ
jgi:hypothetical protein